MNWEALDWAALDRLRERFLNGAAANGPYWQSAGDLANYDQTYGERIGWKWDAVLREMLGRGWRPPRGTLVDWGCGSGVAGRRVLRAWGRGSFDTLRVWDHASLACDFAAEAARREFPGLTVARFAPGEAVGLLVVSHVLNELGPEARAELRAAIRTAQAVLWVEPGTHAVSRDLIAWREDLRAEFRVVAPCTHQAACGLLRPENNAHWCHAHAAIPTGLYADSNWVKFGRRAGIDLRSLPYCFLALERRAVGAGPACEAGAARLIGDPRFYKGYAKLLSCDASGVEELMLQKRTDPAFFKKLDRAPGLPIYHWERGGGRILAARPTHPPAVDE